MALLPLQLYNDVADRCWQNLQGTSIAREVQGDAGQAMDKVLRHMAQEVICWRLHCHVSEQCVKRCCKAAERMQQAA